ncbi:glycerol-3-phosphate dehydrogenase/oxidase [Kocuria atrinae]|uniref:Glycerol-3-phosphate dehydrogenase n=1 Tax=Kocuria atrinae TaxID=592377 RepID=A0ABN2XRT7_9MICC
MRTTVLNPESRQAALREMANGPDLDILVIGGGVTGAGVALDAVTRGLRTGIVEAQDWAGGTSRWSSKLVHGGLRYLQQLDFKLVTEALHERERLLYTLAPHLVKPVPFLYPILHRVWERPYVTAGIGLYDTLAHVGSKVASMPFHRHLSERGVQKAFPSIKPGAMVGAVKYWDGRVDDARLVLTLIRTAAGYGALAASRTKVTGMIKNDDAVVGARVTDLETGEEFEIRARKVIAATGVWTEETQDMADTDGGLKVLASKGIHIVVPRERIKGEVGLILQTEKSVLFVIPWEHYWIIGTTDTPYEQDISAPVATAADIDYVIEHANVVLDDPLTREDVIGSYAGLRPLLQPGVKDDTETASTKVSREHTVAEVVPGLISIAGGKLTTYRIMAQDAVDFALGKERTKQLPSVTERTLLHGADGYLPLTRQIEQISDRYGWGPEMVEHLLNRYGSGISEVGTIVDERADLAEPLKGAPEYIRAEIVQAARNEGVLHLADAFQTRTRMSYDQPDHGLAVVDEVADLLAEELGWDSERKAKEIQAYRDLCAAEDAAAETTDDTAAAAARAAAPSLNSLQN